MLHKKNSNRPKFSFKTTKKEKKLLVFLTCFYFLFGPFQTTHLLARSYPLPSIQIMDNYGGWAFLVIGSFLAYKFFKSGIIAESVVEILTALGRKKEKKEGEEDSTSTSSQP